MTLYKAKKTSRELREELKENEYVLLELSIDAYRELLPELKRVGYVLRKVDVLKFDYSFDPKWEKLDKQSRAIYKQKKDREFDLRMKIEDDAKREEKISKRDG